MSTNNSGRTKSVWMEVELPSFPRLGRSLEADVCIVGAGIAGLTCAYTLAKWGKSVVVLDKGAVGGGQSARTTAHLTWALDDRFYVLERLFGKEGSKIAAESHAAAIDTIEHIVYQEAIDCDFERVDGYLFVPPGESKEILDKELAAIQATGMHAELVAKAPFGSSFNTGPCLRFPEQGQFHILKYLKGLTQAIQKYGGKIYADTKVDEIIDGDPCSVKTDSEMTVLAKSVIVATCTPINDRVMIHTKQAPYRTYVIAAPISKGSVPKALFWDTPDPYHYIRVQKNDADPRLDWLILGGEDHKTGQDTAFNEKFEHLEKWARKRFPQMGKVEYTWSGQVFEPLDGIGFIGKNPHDKNIYIATGDSGNGMTHGTIAGCLIPDIILERPTPWRDLYLPSRKPWTCIPGFIQENTNSFLQLKDWLTPGELKEIEELALDEGKILREGLKKLAVYKDKENKVHIKSALCPHLGGCLRWNSLEKSWDCPLHGSRFDGCGHVLNGPAKDNL